jgi:ACR3 family arsenite efflux pump ArsB
MVIEKEIAALKDLVFIGVIVYVGVKIWIWVEDWIGSWDENTFFVLIALLIISGMLLGIKSLFARRAKDVV